MAGFDEWTAAACRELGLDPAVAATQQRLVLGLAREVAHAVERPAAPVTAYLLGLAAGQRGIDPGHAAAALTALARNWPPARPADQGEVQVDSPDSGVNNS